MGLTLICLALSGALATGVSVLVPQYMINENRMMTALSFFAITLLARLTYAVYLYPRFFTPFKNLPQVSSPLSLEYERVFRNDDVILT